MEADNLRFTLGQRLLSAITGLLPWSLLIFVVAFYAFPSSKSINNWFYAAVALPGLIAVFFVPYRETLQSRIILWVGVFSAFLIGSTVLSITSDFSASDHIKPIIYTILFIIAFSVANEINPNLNKMITSVIIGTAFIAAIYAVYSFYEPRNWIWHARLEGFGGISNPIWISGIYAIPVLLAISRFVTSKGWWSYAYIGLAMPPITVMWLTQSRAPMAGLIVAMIVLCVLFRNRRSLAIILAGASILAGAIVYFLQSEHSTRYLQPPTHRLIIWNNAVDKYLEAPVLGHGLHVDTANISKNHTMQHYHNVYLTVAVQGGTVSLLALLALALSSLKVRVSNDTLVYKSILVLGLVYMLSNGSGIFTSPKELWMLFWLPIAAIWASNRSINASGER